MKYLVVEDEWGILRPMAGIWSDTMYGKQSAEKYQKENPEVKIVKVEINII